MGRDGDVANVRCNVGVIYRRGVELRVHRRCRRKVGIVVGWRTICRCCSCIASRWRRGSRRSRRCRCRRLSTNCLCRIDINSRRRDRGRGGSGGSRVQVIIWQGSDYWLDWARGTRRIRSWNGRPRIGWARIVFPRGSSRHAGVWASQGRGNRLSSGCSGGGVIWSTQ